MGNLEQENTFVERFATFRKLVTPAQLQQAKASLGSNGHPSLLQAMVELGFLSEDDSKAVVQAYEKRRSNNGQAAASPPPARFAEEHAPAESAGAPAPSEPASQLVSPIAATDREKLASFTHLDDFLGYAREVGASDLHINVGCPPAVRKHGRLWSLPGEPLMPEDTERLLFQILTDEQKQRIQEQKALDFCYVTADRSRYRSCILKQRVGWDGAFRIISSRVPTLEELGLPEQLRRLTEFNQGLVLVTGPNGCGKSTTMAAMVELINQHREEHIITIEDPVEYEFVPARAQINQRQVGCHTASFSAALRAALREDPDVIMIGELRDRETVSLAITAAETGHLVFGTMHTTSAARTIDRILDVFPPDEQPQIRSMISESIRGIVCQQLIPRRDGTGRALALEIMLNTPAVGNLIRERKLFQMPSIILTSKHQGMLLLDNSLLDLVSAGTVDGVEAYYAADDKARFSKWAPRIDGMTTEG